MPASPLLRFALPLALLASGCEGPHFALPMTAAGFVNHHSGPALVAYLGQRDATPTVCDLRARGPHLPKVDEEVRTSLVEGLSDGKIDAGVWRRCADALLRSAPGPDAASLIDAIGHDYRAIIKSSDFEKTPALQDRLRVMQQLYIERRNGLDGHAEVEGERFAELRRALAGRALGPRAMVFGQELIEVVDLEHGRWRDRAVDVSMIDTLFAARDEKTLRRFADRLPTPAFRDEARRRVVRLHIGASPFPEVREHAAAVEDVVMKHGVFALPLSTQPPVRGWLDAARVPMRGVLVRQRLWRQTAKLLGYSGERPGISVLPAVNLRGALMMEVTGISRPVTLCGPARDLDPTPCVAAEDVRLENPAAYLDKGGAFHFVDDIAMRDAVDLTRMRDKFELPVSVGGRRLLSFHWPLYYERPKDLVFTGRLPGADGPGLSVTVDHRDPARFIYSVTGGGGIYLAIVERPDAAAFHIVSQGAQGYTGARGADGDDGADGGECGSGEDGDDGGPGGNGGNGGNGGDIVAQVFCGDAPCPDALGLLYRVILSVAGPGGFGGSGGRGGDGGSGGSGRSATTDSDGNTTDSGCSGGTSGSSGNDGPSGPPGAPGRPGRVSVTAGR